MHTFEAEGIAGVKPEPMEPMPVEKLASFNGALEIHRFAHAGNAATGTTHPSKPEPSPHGVKEELSNERDEITGGNAPGPRRSPRRTTRRSTTALVQTTSTTTSRNLKTSRASRSRDATPPSIPPASCLRDTIPHGLILLLVGVNPGIMTGVTGYAYAHPTNQFWKLLYSSGITDQLHPPSDTYKLPGLYNVGNTNIVERPTRDASMLSKQEMLDGVPILEAKIREKKPQAVCLVGKGIWEAVFRVKRGRPLRKEDFKHGWQESFFNMGRDPSDPSWDGTPVFVATTTSGLSTNLTFEQKKAIWAELGQWVKERREAQINASNHDSNHVPNHVPNELSNHRPNDLLDHDLDNDSCGINSGIPEAC